ncbi:hypothetical protein JX265_003381 [Neoarthrinium moseri]|uniref:Uncharacterized protein n=1 Tax=Neoarthrinium moseri TaxID=1658444 RepID=A0A9P9WS16_9PEZI|nr:hypothetical protein JX266_004388 [Neoarthrinium moseri]KAI1877373.1 hypothetical protein JX265_003381 [Neoarthrinium moseri]
MQFSIALVLLPVLALAKPVVEDRQVKKCCYVWEGQPQAYYEVTTDGDYLDESKMCFMYYIRDTSDPDNCDAASRKATSGYCLDDTAFPVVECRS